MVDLTESIFLYLLRFSEGIAFFFCQVLLFFSCLVCTYGRRLREGVERVECCFALLPTTDERTNELSER